MSAELLTTSGAAKRLGYCADTVREMCENGRLPGAYRSGPGGHWRIPAEAVQALIESSRPRVRLRTGAQT